MYEIKVGIADLNITFAPNRLRTTGLGSCVGITLYDESIHLAGLAHVMLPSSELAKGEVQVAKYADTAIPELLMRMERAGGRRSRMKAKLAGGAQMFQNKGNDLLRIGPRNVEASLIELRRLQIPVVAQDTGGNYGRTIEIEAETGILRVWTVYHGEKVI
ncbi:chemotaxis protein CheD [Thermicanus aegyptius]|uniref:chemotaxis protein CheD n=1 Tax=Thermicanus aegyptius TaxID=94009 RepID=UPI0004235500|nr:chemotaxis protein CheD [Thermicanus aegyptius]